MITLRIAPVLITVILISSGSAASQDSLASHSAAEKPAWSYSASTYLYFLPHDKDYFVATASGDHDWLHLECRYNNEAVHTGSFWIGYNISLGEEVHLEVTPVVGGMVGDVAGVAPGYLLTLSGSRLELYSEGAYVDDLRDAEGTYFYTWSELTYAPLEWGRFGFVIQRTRTFESGLDLQRGLEAVFTHDAWSLGTYFFNPGSDDHYVVLNLSVEF